MDAASALRSNRSMQLPCAVALAALAALPAAALAQPPVHGPPPTARARVRSGAFFGIGLGAGNLRLTEESSDEVENYGSFLLFGHLGGLLTARIGVGIALAVASHEEDDSGLKLTQSNLVAFGQMWVLPRLWVRLGLGQATATAGLGNERIRFPGVGLVGSAGFEVVSAPGYSLDATLGLWAAGYEGAAGSSTVGAFGLEFCWH